MTSAFVKNNTYSEIRERSGHYEVSLAANSQEREAVYALRFKVFNLELNEGLESAYATQLDQDKFDEHCVHLIVKDTKTGELVGTYRLQDSQMATAGYGFYSDNEFDLGMLGQEVLSQSIELGRACIALEHRNSRVLYLLWRGLAAFMMDSKHRYFFGCASLTSQNPAEGWQLYQQLLSSNYVHETSRVSVRESFRCSPESPAEAGEVKIPKLMRLYLTYGARVISEPAIDREFGTIDYLAQFDMHSISDTARVMFLKKANG